MPTPPGQPVVQLRLSLQDVEPTVWRRVLVPGSVRLGKLHLMLQAAMGWTNSHLHDFRIGDKVYGGQFEDYPEDELNEDDVSVLQALRGQREFIYEYDFGDGWDHDVVIEAMWKAPLGLKFAVCLDGQNACPPEDCGGPSGYRHLLEVIADPSHDEYDDLLQWLGGGLDRTEFDLAVTNAELQRIR